MYVGLVSVHVGVFAEHWYSAGRCRKRLLLSFRLGGRRKSSCVYKTSHASLGVQVAIDDANFYVSFDTMILGLNLL